ncbi:uncharacterized protein LOC135201192 [Macrobrachium nipponense]|uniref:uncharacterized protein LOC135201192 n=1 Tax=Macrobrachium nipponense TaxID=159736 RepID=UPI0030C8C4C7
MTGGSKSESTPTEHNAVAKEIMLSVSFGDDVSPMSWQSFSSHFSLVKQANLLRGVPSWRDAGYRALMLRLQFRGPTANYVEQQALQDPEWGKDDVAIMDRLAQRILTADAIEVRILRFEESIQLQGESLSDYMTRLQLLAGQAFAKEPADIVRKRVVWRFLSGLHDADVRSQLIREKWMESEETAKSYDEVVKIALAALSTKRATKATGPRNPSVHVNKIEGTSNVCLMEDTPETMEVVTSGEEIGELEPSVVGYDGNHSLLSSIEGKRGNFIVGESLTFEQKEEMDKVLHEFKNVFYNGGSLPLVQVGVEHTIRVNPDSAPIANRPRRLSPALEAEVKKELSKLQDMGVIKKSCSPWAAPIVCARRADGSLRLAIDYRGVNSVSQPATLHPIPVVEDLLDRLGQAKYFSVLDAKSGYHQMPLRKEDCEVSAFVVPWGQFEWHGRTPFGLKGAGYTFQRMMATILSDCNYTDALCYLDDILVWGSTWKEHIARLRNVLSRIRDAGLALAPNKCKFGVREVEYLGSVVGDGMLRISEQRVHQLRDLPRPLTVRQLRQAIGAFSYVQKWIPGMSQTAKPLCKYYDYIYSHMSSSMDSGSTSRGDSKKETCKDEDYQPGSLDNAAIAERFVREKVEKIEKTIKVARNKTAMAQQIRSNQRKSYGKAFKVGDLVRLKLSTAERRRCGGGKLAP